MLSVSEARAVLGAASHYLVKNRKAFTALLIGGIMAIMIGAVLLVVSYVVINAVVASTASVSTGALGPSPPGGGCFGNGTGCLNASFQSSIGQIIQALGIIGIALVITGIAVIVYVLIGLGGTGTSKAGYR